MPCQSCLQARQAAANTIKAIVTLKPSEARQQAAVAIDKVSEALRVRARLGR